MSHPRGAPHPETRVQWTVVCLCAEWCGVCREYRSVFLQLARQNRTADWLWLDIEDGSDTAGEFDVETFPSLLIAHGDQVRFCGPLTPHPAVLERLLQTLRAERRPDSWEVSADSAALWHRIRAACLSGLPGSGLHNPLLAE